VTTGPRWQAGRKHPTRAPGLPSVMLFIAWSILGAVGALGLLSLGWLVLVPVFAAAILLVIKTGDRDAVFGAMSGAGIGLLLVAYQQRRGPGTICWHRGQAGGCDEYLNPVPWATVGGILVIAGIAGYLYSATRHGRTVDRDRQR
jgi:hypothetical protein